jgi:hypothetical protein
MYLLFVEQEIYYLCLLLKALQRHKKDNEMFPCNGQPRGSQKSLCAKGIGQSNAQHAYGA